MPTRAKGTSRAAVLAAGFVAFGVTALPSSAFADDGGVLSGNQIDAPVSAPADVSGNGASLLGNTYATSRGGTKIRKSGGAGRHTSGERGIASGNQVNAPISLPVNVCGNGAAVLGHADAGCKGGAKVEGGGDDGQVTDGTAGVVAGNRVNAPISAPVNVCGNAVAIAGDAVAGCEGGAHIKNGGHTGSGQETSGMFGVGSGNQANLPISIPVDACGNAVGNAPAACAGGASVRNGGHRTGHQATGGVAGVLSGNQANAPISIPLTACGNAAAIIGQAGAFCEGGSHVRSGSGGDQHTSGTHGVLAGNQGNTPISLPVEICGNAAAAAGLASANCDGRTKVKGSHGSGAQASGGNGVGSGNQANAPAKAPANACGNAAALAGLASALCHGDHGGYRKSTPPQNPATGDLPRLPVAGTLTEADRPSDLAGLPGASTLPRADGLPDLDGLPATSALTATGGVPAAGARSSAGDAPATNVLPGLGGASPISALPEVGGLGVAGLPAVNGLAKREGLSGTKALPEVGSVSAAEALPGVGGVREHNLLPGAKALPGIGGLAGLPGAGAVSRVDAASARNARTTVAGLPSPIAPPRADGLVAAGGGSGPAHGIRVPGADALPKAGGLSAISGMPAVGRPGGGGSVVPASPVVPSAKEIGPVRPVAGVQVMPSERAAGATWTFGAAGLLAFAAGVLGAARRFGRR